MTVEERLGSIDVGLAALEQRLTDHTNQDDANFSRLSGQLESIDEKLDQLLIREAGREGEVKGIRRSVIAIATVIPLIITIAGWILPRV